MEESRQHPHLWLAKVCVRQGAAVATAERTAMASAK